MIYLHWGGPVGVVTFVVLVVVTVVEVVGAKLRKQYLSEWLEWHLFVIWNFHTH